jgi:CHAT domain-containing protein/tetratricopeptide (TPR) repeat protein
MQSALELEWKLYPSDKYPDGHPDLANCLFFLGLALHSQSQSAAAEPYLRDALSMRRRLYPPTKYPDGHLVLVQSLIGVAASLTNQGRPAAAEPFLRESLLMYRQLYPSDKYPDGDDTLPTILNNLGYAILNQGKPPATAEPFFRDAVDMRRKHFPPDKYPDHAASLAMSMGNLACVLQDQGKLAAAEPLFRDALAMLRRIYPEVKYPNGHPDLAITLSNLGLLLDAQGQPAAAEPLYRDALAMYRRLYPADKFPAGHPTLTKCMLNLAVVLPPAAAEPLEREAMDMYRALTEEYAKSRPDGEALTVVGSFPVARDGYLSLGLERPDAAAQTYAAVWPSRAAVSRILERKHFAARAAVAAPEAHALWKELSNLRRQRAHLILAPTPRDQESRKARDQMLEQSATRITELERDLRVKLPDLDRADAVAKSSPADVQAALPLGAAFIDLLRYTRITFNPARRGLGGMTRTTSYVAFVVTKQQVARVELGPAGPIEAAVAGWLAAITRNAPDGDFPTSLRTLVWDKLAPHLPAGIDTVYLAPDQALARVPWAALPGAKPGTVLLEDHALVTVPHGQFLLAQLTAPTPAPNATGGVLVVGGVKYGDAPSVPPAAADADDPTATRAGGGSWRELPGTAREAERVAAMSAARRLAVTTLTGVAAGPDAVRAALPKVRVAHLATHGFFADAKFRSALQVDPKLFEIQGRERVGAGVLSPLVLSGLVFAGANHPDAPGRGLVTGEALVGLDLSGLELAVLSACETGLGDVAGGEGVFGLQKAFHLAGCKNVVASLWKVDDDATAALMGLFYRGLWVDKLPAREALRRAQLTLYRHPELTGLLAKKRGADFTESDLPAVTATPPAAGPAATTSQWAAFVLSGIGQ